MSDYEKMRKIIANTPSPTTVEQASPNEWGVTEAFKTLEQMTAGSSAAVGAMSFLRQRIERVETALRGVQSCSTCEACQGAATLVLGDPPGIPAHLEMLAKGAAGEPGDGRVEIPWVYDANWDPQPRDIPIRPHQGDVRAG